MSAGEETGHITFGEFEEGEQIPRETMSEKQARVSFHNAITASNYVSGGGRDGYKSLLSFVIYFLDSDFGEHTVSAIMEELGWERIDKSGH